MATTTQTITTTHPQVTAHQDPNFIPRGPVTASLSFYKPPVDGSKPFNYVEAPPPGQPQRNYSDVNHDVQINDIRGRESAFNLHTNAFATFQTAQPSAEPSFTDDASIKQHYYPEVERSLLTHVPGSPHRVVLFDHTIRRADPSSPRNPVVRTHIDQSKASAEARVRQHLPADEAATLLHGRVRIINVWRPLNGPVQSFPLAFADSATVQDDALVGIEHRYPTWKGETVAVAHAATQEWYYWSGMGDQEGLFLQCYDSRGTGARVPHSAFVDPRTPAGARGRESIEVRALVFG